MPTLTHGTRLGAYEVITAIGAGGMGEVYRARDARLNRDVALKVLPELFALDPDRLARFRREAQVLASLNHPNIAAIHGFEESNSVQALVLELVEGPTLADRIANGAMPPDEAVPIARQIAEALEAAHEQGIVHRDLKPANIKLRPDGTVKVLDFGLAKALEPEPIGSGGVTSPTITSPALTQMGVILGTAAYMSPEQVKGRPADKRSDVWAFGVVLYEMLSGDRAFKGDDMADTLAAVLRQNVDMTILPGETPASVRRLIARCLDRDVKRRLRDIGEARIALENSLSATDEDVTPRTVPAPARPLWRRAVPIVLAALAGGAAAGGAMWTLNNKPAPAAGVTRLPLPLPSGDRFTAAMARHVLAASPDGRVIVYASNNRLYKRSMPELAARPVPGTEDREGALSPVFSPDGRELLFYASSARAIKKIGIDGGAATTICAAENPFGISWSTDGIVFGQGSAGIMRVSPGGGTPAVVARVKEGEQAHGPQLLPGGQHLMYTLATGRAMTRWDNARIVVQPLPSGEPKTVIDGGSDARYLPTGHLVFGQGTTLYAAAFDLERQSAGTRVAMIESVMFAGGRSTGAYQFSIAGNGSLIYVPGNDLASGSEPLDLVITDRKGAVERLKLPPFVYTSPPRISPDGKRVVFGINDGKESVIYTYDLSGEGSMERATFGGNNRLPVWSSDGTRIAFQSDREGDLGIWQSTIGGPVTRVTTAGPGESHEPEDWHPKTDVLLFNVTKKSDVALWTVSIPDGKPTPFRDTRSNYPTGARFHPSGRWVAYTISREMAGSKLYVDAFPSGGPLKELYIAGANPAPHKVAWSADGHELFYVPRIFEFEAVSVTTDPTFSFGNAITVPRPFQPGAPNSETLFDVMPTRPDRFLGLIPPGRTDSIPRSNREMIVVLNWLEELRARVPSR